MQVSARRPLRILERSRDRLRLEFSRPTSAVIDGEDVDVLWTDDIEDRVGKAMERCASHLAVLDGIDLGLPAESGKASIEGSEEDLAES